MFNKRLRQLRIEKDITQKKLGEIVGVSHNTIANYEKGDRQPEYNILLKIADVFECSVDYLLGRVDKKDEYLAVINAAKTANVSPDKLNSYIDFLKNSK